MVSIPKELEQFVKIKTTKQNVNGLEFRIDTYSVIATNEQGKVNKKRSYNDLDDNTYTIYPELIKLVPRGLSIAYYSGKEVCRLDGLEKFDGSCPLDDDNEHETSIFNKNAMSIKNWTNLKVEFLEKANGKMAIFKIFPSPVDTKKYFILGGSKNVHVIIDINELVNPERTELHYQMLKHFQNDCKNKGVLPINQTIIGEYVDGQHIVYTSVPYLTYFSGPFVGVKHIFPAQNTIPSQEQLRTLRTLENTEGAVIVYTNLDTGTVFRQKHKSIWYILIRVMREGLKKFSKENNIDDIVDSVYLRIVKRSEDFLSLNIEELDKWNIILRNFVLFIKWSKYQFSDLDHQKIGIATIYNEFINTDKMDYQIVQNQEQKEFIQKESEHDPQLYEYIKQLYDCRIKVCVIMRGLSGSGKSTIAARIKEESNKEAQIFSTDELFTKDDIYTFDRSKLEEFHNKNFENFKQAVHDNVGCVIVDNTNIHYAEYQRYIDLARNNGYVTVIMQTKKISPGVLFSRSIHNVSIEAITTKYNRYEIVNPIYYGIFFNSNKILNILKETGYTPVQTTPFHITLYYGSEIKDTAYESIQIGKEYIVLVHSLCTNKAGKFLKATINDFKKSDNFHITLETFKGFKPVDLGLHAAESSQIVINKEISGIYGTIF